MLASRVSECELVDTKVIANEDAIVSIKRYQRPIMKLYDNIHVSVLHSNKQ